MLFIVRLAIILCLPVAVFSELVAEPMSGSTSDVSTQKPNKEAETETSKASANSTERFVMPVTGWMENKVQKSSVLNPLLKKTKEKVDTSNKTTLRQAILLARQIYHGTVLSARKTTDSNTQAPLYKIKILSKDGAVREIDVPVFSVQENEKQ